MFQKISLPFLSYKKNSAAQVIDRQEVPGVFLHILEQSGSPISEIYRSIRTSIQSVAFHHSPLKTLVVTSSGPGEGKSTVIANLAIVFAQSGHRVLLVDADLRKPTVHHTFHMPNEQGLSRILVKNYPIEEEIRKTDVENLSVLTSGPRPVNPAELVNSPTMMHLIETLSQQYDLVLFDTPPLVVVTDSQIISGKVDGTLLIVRDGISKKQELLRAKELLDLVQAYVIGVVYNGKNHQLYTYQYLLES